MENFKILVIEDESQISRVVSLELQHEGYVTDIASDGISGLNKVHEGKYDLILLDLMIPGLNGMEVCRRIREFSDVPIIMLTSKLQVADKVRGLDLGANDYITKPFAIEELIARIRTDLRHSKTTSTDNKVLQVDDLIMNISTHKIVRNEKIIILSKKEFDLLEYLIRNRGIVVNRDQIMENVWGYDYSGDTNIVDIYIKHLRAKIDEGFESRLIHTVRGFGYVLKDYINES